MRRVLDSKTCVKYEYTVAKQNKIKHYKDEKSSLVDSAQCLSVVSGLVIFCHLQRCHNAVSVKVAPLVLDLDLRLRLLATRDDLLLVLEHPACLDAREPG